MNKENDNVRNPSHYQVLDGLEAIEIIASCMTLEQFHGYCLGNILKYRIRTGKKDNLEQDIAKADFYKELYDEYKIYCKVM